MMALSAVSGASSKVPRAPLVVSWVLGFAGAYLLWSALTDRSPIEDLRATLTGGSAEPARALPGRSSGGGGATGGTTADPTTQGANGPATGVGPAAGSRPPVISQDQCERLDTRLSQGVGYTIFLAPAAAASFRIWAELLRSAGLLPAGKLIPCTGGWRSCADADAKHRAEPDRFASCAESWHTPGVAVDVDMTWLGKLSAADQDKVRLGAAAAGWRQARWKGPAQCGNNPNNDNEPWHFSYGGCG